MIALKRRLDTDFFAAAPLFSAQVLDAYARFMNQCFRTFNSWGEDAQLRTSAYRRRQAAGSWRSEWDHHFAYDDSRPISATEQSSVRSAYDALVASLVSDLDITRARTRYASDSASLNAHAPRAVEISGR